MSLDQSERSKWSRQQAQNLILRFFSHNYHNYSMFRDVPGCSGMFRDVPCSGFYRRPPFVAKMVKVSKEHLETNELSNSQGPLNGFSNFTTTTKVQQIIRILTTRKCNYSFIFASIPSDSILISRMPNCAYNRWVLTCLCGEISRQKLR